ncbi:hypothetical protein I4F81_004090 [Pyropia yezoensis]|uniref:Uncharacterized protein n=1 Tax=Pyropia yezoensis TaxID=2788 RepID=A0ACC3BUZ2_PYRYE|nr:hypothetical protein I4F81_004090 [Neopyropia yezoensis]
MGVPPRLRPPAARQHTRTSTPPGEDGGQPPRPPPARGRPSEHDSSTSAPSCPVRPPPHARPQPPRRAPAFSTPSLLAKRRERAHTHTHNPPGHTRVLQASVADERRCRRQRRLEWPLTITRRYRARRRPPPPHEAGVNARGDPGGRHCRGVWGTMMSDRLADAGREPLHHTPPAPCVSLLHPAHSSVARGNEVTAGDWQSVAKRASTPPTAP